MIVRWKYVEDEWGEFFQDSKEPEKYSIDTTDDQFYIGDRYFLQWWDDGEVVTNYEPDWVKVSTDDPEDIKLFDRLKKLHKLKER